MATTADTDLVLAAADLRSMLLDGDDEGMKQAAKADGMTVRMTSEATSGLAASEVNVTRLRLSLKGS